MSGEATKCLPEREQGLWRAPALRQAGWLLVATVLTGGMNYLANAGIGRLLGPADYSVYAALLSLYNIFIALTGVIQTAVTNYTARLVAAHDWPRLRGMALAGCRWLIPVGMVAGAAVALVSGPISWVLHIPRPEPVWMLAVTLVPLALMPLGLGLLGGQQRFGPFGSAHVGGAAARLLSALVLVRLGAGATGAVASLAFAASGTVIVASLLLSEVWRNWQERSKPELEGLSKFMLHTALGTVGFALLTGMDVLVVKSRFPPAEAGMYASVSIVGKIALWIPAALIAFLVPKAAARHARKQNPAPLLRGTQSAVLVLCSGMAVLFFGLATPLVQLLFGPEYIAGARLLGPYGLVMALYAVVGIWFNYFLAVRDMRYTWILMGTVVLQAVVLASICRTPSQIVWVMLAMGAGLVVCGEVVYSLAPGKRKLRCCHP